MNNGRTCSARSSPSVKSCKPFPDRRGSWPPKSSALNCPNLLYAQSCHGVDRSCAPGRNDTGDESADRESSDGSAEDERVPALHFIEPRLDQECASDRRRYADEQADEDLQESSAQNEADDGELIRAESHADTDLAGAALHAVGGDAIESDSGQDEREDAEEAGHLRDGALLIEAVCNLLLHGLHVDERKVRVDRREDTADLRFEAASAAVHLQHGALDHVGAVVHHLHHGLVVMLMLSERHEEERWPPVAAGVGVVRGAYDAYDLECAAILRIVQAEMRTDG